MTIPSHLLEKVYAASSSSVEKTNWTRSAYNAGFLAGASTGYQLRVEEENKLLDEVERALSDAGEAYEDSYDGEEVQPDWYTNLNMVLAKLKAHRGAVSI